MVNCQRYKYSDLRIKLTAGQRMALENNQYKYLNGQNKAPRYICNSEIFKEKKL